MFVKCAKWKSNDEFCVSLHIWHPDMDLCDSRCRWLIIDTENYTGYILVRSQGRNISQCSRRHLTNTNPNVDTWYLDWKLYERVLSINPNDLPILMIFKNKPQWSLLCQRAILYTFHVVNISVRTFSTAFEAGSSLISRFSWHLLAFSFCLLTGWIKDLHALIAEFCFIKVCLCFLLVCQ